MKLKDLEPKRLWNTNKPALFAGVVCLIVLISLCVHQFHVSRFIDIEDAQVQAHFTALTTKIPGRVVKIIRNEQEWVRQGEILAEIDDRDYQTEVRRTHAAYLQEQTRAHVFALDRERAESLLSRGHTSIQSAESAQTQALSASKSSLQARALWDAAKLNLEYTSIKAPSDGYLAERSVSEGTELKAGDPVFGFVIPSQKWVIAKIKETDLPDIRVGQAAQIKIDALPGRDFQGTVLSISPTTEGVEAAVPPDNASGNYKKYVQRIDVKIGLSLSPEDQKAVRAGLSAVVSMRRGS